MEMMEIVLLIAGGVIFILSFFIPDKFSGKKDGGSEGEKVLAKGELQGLISQEMDSIRSHVDDVVEEAVTYAMEKTERSLERLSNEKIMAVSEYSDTVLAEIHKNHEEAMFLYDMLNNKHINLKNTVSEVNRTVKEAETAVMNFQKLAPETLAVSEERILNQTAGTERAKIEGFGTERAGIGRTGTERAGIGRTGIERAGIERVGTERTGIEKFGTERTGIERTGIERTGIERTGIEKPGIQRAGFQWTETDKTTLEGSAINNAMLEKPGMENAKADNLGIDHSPTGRMKTERSGLERLGAFLEASPGKVSFMQDVDEQGRNSNERILELFQQGRSTVAIAKELGLGVGEVKLVIDLFKNQ